MIDAARADIFSIVYGRRMSNQHLMQSLERRRVMNVDLSARSLFVVGTDGNDVFEVFADANQITVSITNDSGTTVESRALMSGPGTGWASIDARGGNDVLRLNNDLDFDVNFVGGLGHDIVDLQGLSTGVWAFIRYTAGNGFYDRYAILQVDSGPNYGQGVTCFEVEGFGLTRFPDRAQVGLGTRPKDDFVSVRVQMGAGDDELEISGASSVPEGRERIAAMVDLGQGVDRLAYLAHAEDIRITGAEIRSFVPPSPYSTRRVVQEVLGDPNERQPDHVTLRRPGASPSAMT